MVLPEDDITDLTLQVREMREQLGAKFRAQAEQLQRLERDLKQLRDEHEQLESEAWRQFQALGESEPSSSSTRLAAVLAAARKLLSAASSQDIFSKLTEEVHQMGVRAVVFEVRGKAAWAASAHGFEPPLTEQTLRSLVVPLNVETPFRKVFELGQHFGGNPDVLMKNPNVLSRLKPDSRDSILLLPIRWAGSVAAILYADSTGSAVSLPEDALKLLAEFAGAQLDRLMAVGARRLARLMVLEIELYNTTQVVEGRKSKDLYKRLKVEIERSRQTFEQRFGKTGGRRFDYFHDELVRTLAGNDPSFLGSDYPGPSV